MNRANYIGAPEFFNLNQACRNCLPLVPHLPGARSPRDLRVVAYRPCDRVPMKGLCTVLTWSDVSFSLDGQEFSTSRVEVARNPSPPFSKRREYIAEATCIIEGKAARELLDALYPSQRGASDAILAKRMRYGGRKGRSAWRRLRAKGFVGTMRINDEPPVPMPPMVVEFEKRKQ